MRYLSAAFGVDAGNRTREGSESRREAARRLVDSTDGLLNGDGPDALARFYQTEALQTSRTGNGRDPARHPQPAPAPAPAGAGRDDELRNSGSLSR